MTASPQSGQSGSKPATTPAQRRAHAGPLARLPLKQKLPLMVAVLLLTVVGALLAGSYVEVRATTLRLASERLVALTQQLGALFATSGPQQRAGIAAVASRPGVGAFARTKAPTKRQRDAALADLRQVASGPEAVLATEVRDAKGTILLSTDANAGLEKVPIRDVLPSIEPGDSAVIGSFHILRDTIVYAVAGAVKGSDDVYVVRWRRLTLTPRTRETLDRLIGTYGTPYLGNPRGSTWVDFIKRVPAPPFDYSSTAPVQIYERDGEAYLGAMRVLPGTPWSLAVDVPMNRVLAPANAFIWRYGLLALVALLIALTLARVFTSRLTRPLVALSDAANAIAAGDFSREVRVDRADELGDLGQAFATMATEVQTARDHLERRVHERTADLSAAMTKLEDAQESLVRRERLALLGQLASGVGHELRNPLGVMTNSVYYLRAILKEQPKEVHEYFDILQQQISLSEKIVGDLLDFTRSKAPQRASASLSAVLSAQIMRMGNLNGVQLESQVNGDLPAIFVDSMQIGQIVLNLLTNAVQAMGGNGRIQLKVQVDGDQLHLDVADTGPGVPSQNAEKIFEPLFTTKARGIGLGLAVSRQLARANGGDLVLATGAGSGAVFRLTLPLVPGSAS
jgi:signal transduction histidine kinase